MSGRRIPLPIPLKRRESQRRGPYKARWCISLRDDPRFQDLLLRMNLEP